MSPKRSAGLLVFRRDREGGLEVLLAHPGGPFWTRRDTGAWSIPKGEYGTDEDALVAARREFAEELGSAAPAGEAIDLGEIVQANRKVVQAWALEGDLDVARITSNEFELEWPPRSGTRASFPEVDRAQWFDLETARTKLLAGQAPLLDRLREQIGCSRPGEGADSGESRSAER